MPATVQPGSSYIGLTLQEMIDEVEDQIRNTQISAKITRWLNLSALRIYAGRIFPFFQMRHVFSTVSADDLSLYPLPFGTRAILSVRVGTIGRERKLWPTTIDEVNACWPTWWTQKGQVTHYIFHRGYELLNPDTPGYTDDPLREEPVIRVLKVPDQDEIIECYVHLGPNKLVDLSDVSTFPSEWHPLIIQGAVIRGKAYERMGDLPEARSEYREMERNLLKIVYSDPGQHLVFRTNQGPYDPAFRKWPPSIDNWAAHYPHI